jgi:hypothetical protein
VTVVVASCKDVNLFPALFVRYFYKSLIFSFYLWQITGVVFVMGVARFHLPFLLNIQESSRSLSGGNGA